jgi:hypothetical protein
VHCRAVRRRSTTLSPSPAHSSNFQEIDLPAVRSKPQTPKSRAPNLRSFFFVIRSPNQLRLVSCAVALTPRYRRCHLACCSGGERGWPPVCPEIQKRRRAGSRYCPQGEALSLTPQLFVFTAFFRISFQLLVGFICCCCFAATSCFSLFNHGHMGCAGKHATAGGACRAGGGRLVLCDKWHVTLCSLRSLSSAAARALWTLTSADVDADAR